MSTELCIFGQSLVWSALNIDYTLVSNNWKWDLEYATNATKNEQRQEWQTITTHTNTKHHNERLQWNNVFCFLGWTCPEKIKISIRTKCIPANIHTWIVIFLQKGQTGNWNGKHLHSLSHRALHQWRKLTSVPSLDMHICPYTRWLDMFWCHDLFCVTLPIPPHQCLITVHFTFFLVSS